MKKFIKRFIEPTYTESGEIYIDTITKVIICVIVGALVLSAMYPLISGAMNTATEEVNNMLMVNPAENHIQEGDESSDNESSVDEHLPISYTITYNLTDCVINNNIEAINENEAYSSIIIPDVGFCLFRSIIERIDDADLDNLNILINYPNPVIQDRSGVIITMGEVDITSVVFDYRTGVIDIQNVSGNISINISAIELYTMKFSSSYSEYGYYDPCFSIVKPDNSILTESFCVPGLQGQIMPSGYIIAYSSWYSYDYTVNNNEIIITHVNHMCLTGDMIIDETEKDKKRKKKRGKKTRLDEIKPDGKILAFNLDTGKVEEQSISTLKNKYTGNGKCWAEKYQVYTFSDGTIIKEVHNHRFFNATHMQFMYMKDWAIGDLVYKIDGTTPYLVKKEVINERVRYYSINSIIDNCFVNGCLSGDRNSQKFEINMVDGKLIQNRNKPIEDYAGKKDAKINYVDDIL